MLSDASEILSAVCDRLHVTLVDVTQTHAEVLDGTHIFGYQVVCQDQESCTTELLIVLECSKDAAQPPQLPADDSASILLVHPVTGQHVLAWLYPADPRLPGLAIATVPAAVRTLLGRLIDGADRIGADQMRLAVMSFRPGKRAVVKVEVEATGQQWYVKVVRPSRVARIVETHRHFLAAGVPVPKILGWTDDGIILLAPVPGVPLSEVLDHAPIAAVMDSITTLTDAISLVELTEPARTSLSRRAQWYRDQLVSVMPERTALVDRIVQAASRMLIDSDSGGESVGPFTTIHGDLHLGQIMVMPDNPATIVGVLDIDTAGRGRPEDDQASLWAHAAVTAIVSRANQHEAVAEACHQLVSQCASRAGTQTTATTLIHLVAHAFTYASRGDHRTAETVLGRAASILFSDESSLMGLSNSAHNGATD